MLPLKTRVAATGIASTTTEANENTISGQVVFHEPRTPPTFHGDAFEDGKDRLYLYESIASLYGWDEKRKMHNVYFTLDDYAKT